VKSTILHLIGANGTGKTALLRYLELRPDLFGCIAVGQILRARHGDGFFKGQAAPEHTKAEAMEIYLKFVQDQLWARRPVIVVDGQPRAIDQVRIIDEYFRGRNDVHLEFFLMHADHATRERRVWGRDILNKDAYALAMARLDNDYRMVYEQMIELSRLGYEIEICDTEVLTTSQIGDKLISDFAAVYCG
jgi:adenylate kinase family enzyme